MSYRIVLFLFCSLWLVLIAGCGGKSEKKVTIHLRGGFGRYFDIRKLRFNEGREVVIDSGRTRSNNDSVIIRMAADELNAYQLRIEGKPVPVDFINDAEEIDLFYNIGTDEYHFLHSPASTSWKLFHESQLAEAEKARELNRQADNLAQTAGNHALVTVLQNKRDSVYRSLNTRNTQYADTVSNPALFMLAYNLVEFGRDFKALKTFILRAGQRFPAYQPVQELMTRTLDFVKIYEEEYQVGDVLPELVLPDRYGNNFSTYSLKGKYVLMDFWSTWCDQCRLFSEAKKKTMLALDSTRFGIISIAVDAEKFDWKNIIDHEKYSWPQLIDEQMWSGKAVKTLKFDSIPFNFLLDPRGRVLAKAIPADSLLQVVRHFVKK